MQMFELKAGDRVALHPATDHWARGDRYGTVTIARVGMKFARIRLDSGKVVRVSPQNITEVIH